MHRRHCLASCRGTFLNPRMSHMPHMQDFAGKNKKIVRGYTADLMAVGGEPLLRLCRLSLWCARECLRPTPVD